MIEFTSEKLEMKFEWDELKETVSFRKHGVMFHTAALVFGDRFRVEFYDSTHSGEEDRYVTIGMAENVLCRQKKIDKNPRKTLILRGFSGIFTSSLQRDSNLRPLHYE